jgi:hypothetical protein
MYNNTILMGFDDEIAVVSHDNRWYVGILHGGASIRDIINSSRAVCESFECRLDALNYAADLFIKHRTEYGIRIYI